MENLPVIVTRPLKQAELLAKEIESIGRHPIIFPLLDILPPEDKSRIDMALSHLDQYACVIFVSPSAIDSMMPLIKKWPHEVSIGLVGEGSRLALSKYHDTVDGVRVFTPNDPEKSDSEGLSAVLPVAGLQHKRVLIVRGQSGRDLLGKFFENHDVAVDYLPAYQRVSPEFTLARQQQLDAILKEKNDWIFTSSEALHTLMAWIKQYGELHLVAKLQHQRIIVTHPHIEDTALRLGFSHVVLSGTGNKQLIAFLQY